MNRFLEILKFYWKRNKTIPILLFITIFVVFFLITGNGTFLPKLFINFWDPLISIYSFALTVGLTFIYINKDWIDHLPRKMNVHYINSHGMYLASCYNVDVVTNSDLRALGQQVGAQMFGNQQLKFNPSLKLVTIDKPLEVKKHTGEFVWIKYSDVNFYLTLDDYNNDSSYYTVWNINNNISYELRIPPDLIPFHVSKNISINELLSEDNETLNTFNSLKVESPVSSIKLYIVNSPIIDGSGVYDYETISQQKAKDFIKDKTFISAIGHESTAEVLSVLLGKEVKYNRIQIKLNEGDQCLVFRLKNRIEEGKLYTKDDIQKLDTEFGILIKRVKEKQIS